jgi:hypothetical protein
MKLSQAARHVRWLKADETNVSRTISVLILRELKYSWKHLAGSAGSVKSTPKFSLKINTYSILFLKCQTWKYVKWRIYL